MNVPCSTMRTPRKHRAHASAGHSSLGTKPAGAGRRSRSPRRRRATSTKPIGRCCSSSRCAMRLAVRASMGTPLMRQQRIAGVEQHRRDRAGHVHRERLAPDLAAAGARRRRATSMWRPAVPASVGDREQPPRRADRCPCAAGGRSPASGCRAARISRAPLRAAASSGSVAARAEDGGEQTRRPRRRSRGSPNRSPGFRRRPRPAAPPGAAASVMRLACDARHQAVLGDRHQRGIEHAALRRARQLARDQQPGVIGESDRADQLRAQVAAAHDDRRPRWTRKCADVRCACEPIFIAWTPRAFVFSHSEIDSFNESAREHAVPARAARQDAAASSFFAYRNRLRAMPRNQPRRAAKSWEVSPRASRHQGVLARPLGAHAQRNRRGRAHARRDRAPLPAHARGTRLRHAARPRVPAAPQGARARRRVSRSRWTSST